MPAPMLLETNAITSDQIHSLFSQAQEFDDYFQKGKTYFLPEKQLWSGKSAVGLFFENSTRTSTSFQLAASRLGIHYTSLNMQASSLEKGETIEDTVLNVMAMQPDILVVRNGNNPELINILKSAKSIVVSGGDGTHAHPTQALLDAWTVLKELGEVRGQKIVYTGDVKHSRVARSGFDVFRKLGAEVAFCGPEEFMPSDSELKSAKRFSSIDEAISWCSVFVGLRVQFERHEGEKKLAADYHSKFGLNSARLRQLHTQSIVMHPGPINYGIEFSTEVNSDPRSRVLQQVRNGVFIRAAVFDSLLKLQKRSQ